MGKVTNFLFNNHIFHACIIGFLVVTVIVFIYLWSLSNDNLSKTKNELTVAKNELDNINRSLSDEQKSALSLQTKLDSCNNGYPLNTYYFNSDESSILRIYRNESTHVKLQMDIYKGNIQNYKETLNLYKIGPNIYLISRNDSPPFGYLEIMVNKKLVFTELNRSLDKLKHYEFIPYDPP